MQIPKQQENCLHAIFSSFACSLFLTAETLNDLFAFLIFIGFDKGKLLLLLFLTNK